MTYFDPEIYDPKKLVDEDAIEMTVSLMDNNDKYYEE